MQSFRGAVVTGQSSGTLNYTHLLTYLFTYLLTSFLTYLLGRPAVPGALARGAVYALSARTIVMASPGYEPWTATSWVYFWIRIHATELWLLTAVVAMGSVVSEIKHWSPCCLHTTGSTATVHPVQWSSTPTTVRWHACRDRHIGNTRGVQKVLSLVIFRYTFGLWNVTDFNCIVYSLVSVL